MNKKKQHKCHRKNLLIRPLEEYIIVVKEKVISPEYIEKTIKNKDIPRES